MMRGRGDEEIRGHQFVGVVTGDMEELQIEMRNFFSLNTILVRPIINPAITQIYTISPLQRGKF